MKMTEEQIGRQLESGTPIGSLISQFPSIDAAYRFLANYAASRFPSDPAKSDQPVAITWRLVYYNWRTGLGTILALPLIFLGHIHESHVELKFTTYHYWPKSVVRSIKLKNRLFEVARHLILGAQVVLLLAIVFITVPLIGFLFGPEKISPYHWLSFAGVLIAIFLSFKAKSQTYRAPLPAELKFLAASRAQPVRLDGKLA